MRSHCLGDLCSSLKQCCILEGNYEKKAQHTERGERKKKTAPPDTHTHKKKRKRRRHQQHNTEIYSRKKNWTRAKEIAGNQECKKRGTSMLCMHVCIRTAGNVGGGVIQGHETSRRQHNNLIWFLEQIMQGPCEGISWCLGVVHSYDNLPIRLHCCNKQKTPKKQHRESTQNVEIISQIFCRVNQTLKHTSFL